MLGEVDFISRIFSIEFAHLPPEWEAFKAQRHSRALSKTGRSLSRGRLDVAIDLQPQSASRSVCATTELQEIKGRDLVLAQPKSRLSFEGK